MNDEVKKPSNEGTLTDVENDGIDWDRKKQIKIKINTKKKNFFFLQ